MKKIQEGFQNENDFVAYLDKRKISDLNKSMFANIQRMFNADLTKGSLFKLHCELVYGYQKPDIVLRFKKERAYISLKSGNSQIFHTEYIEPFIKFLRSLKISEETLKTIVLFHWGDGTYDGSGKHRMDGEEAFSYYRERIRKANEELNSNVEVVWKVIERCLFTGSESKEYAADFIIHGNIDINAMISKSQMKKYMKKIQKWDRLHHLHVGPLLIRPHARYPHGKPIGDQLRRRCVEMYWPTALADFAYIDRRFND